MLYSCFFSTYTGVTGLDLQATWVNKIAAQSSGVGVALQDKHGTGQLILS